MKNFGKSLNSARIKLFSSFIFVCFEKLVSCFENNYSSDSSLRLILRFIVDYILDKDLIARLIFALLSDEPPDPIAMDRTNWRFEDTNINIFILDIVYKGTYSGVYPFTFSGDVRSLFVQKRLGRCKINTFS